MTHTPLHARPEPVFIIAVVLLTLWIFGAGLAGLIIGMLLFWKNPHTVAAIVWLGAAFGLFGFFVHFLTIVSNRLKPPSNPTPHVDARDVPLSTNNDSAFVSEREEH